MQNKSRRVKCLRCSERFTVNCLPISTPLYCPECNVLVIAERRAEIALEDARR